MVFNSDKVNKNIAYYRNKRGMSQSELAVLCNLTPGYIANLERNVNKCPTIDTLASIAHALNVSIDVLLKENLKIYENTDKKDATDKELLNIFYTLPTKEKNFILKVMDKLDIYLAMIGAPTIPAKNHSESNIESPYLQDIITNINDLDEMAQFYLLGIVQNFVKYAIQERNNDTEQF